RLASGKIVAATDQGLVVFAEGRAETVFGETEGAPDNLVLSVAVDEQDRVWAGTHRGGVFRWSPGAPLRTLPGAATGAVARIAVAHGRVWAGTRDRGLLVLDTALASGPLRPHATERPPAVRDLMVGAGHVWWCDGTATLHRADPHVLVAPELDGLDMRAISALCFDARQRAWFALPQGVYARDAGEHVLTRVLQVPHSTPVTAMAVDADGTLWVATFGDGVHAVRADGRVERHGMTADLCNPNVLAVRVLGRQVWCATLDGLCVRDQATGRWRPVPMPGPGFVYDVLPQADDGAIAATDGNGLLRVDAAGRAQAVDSLGPRTFYTLLRTADGTVWAAGPGTGLCRMADGGLECSGGELPPFNEGTVLAMAAQQGRVLVFGTTGTWAHDPATGQWHDLTAGLRAAGMQAALHAVATLDDGSVRLGCDRGLLHLRPSPTRYRTHLRTVITGLRTAGRPLPVREEVATPHDRNDLAVQFAAPYFDAPGEVRYVYRLEGHDPAPRTTRDREVHYTGLPPGRYTFRVHALLGETVGPPPATAATLVVHVRAPWWERPGGMALIAGLAVAAVVLVVRARERRLRQRERVEQERVRAQLETLRSQVDPHFLFNSLNTLTALIETDADRAVEHVDQLSGFFRSILQVRDKELVPLHEELDLLAGYFDLERARFGAAIALDVQVPSDAMDRWIVPLTTQMLVENALKHNAAGPQAPLTVRITVEGEELVVRNRRSPRVGAPRSTAFGLDSIRRRYAALDPRPVQVVQDDATFMVRVPLVRQWP
ncbi:MAG: histidine kinase, partial [Flavobacteriales bacterium]|nr:histidine kinase [Flavobacteriales bacterium]